MSEDLNVDCHFQLFSFLFISFRSAISNVTSSHYAHSRVEKFGVFMVKKFKPNCPVDIFISQKKIEVNNLILRCQMRRDSLSIQAANNQTITPISDPTFHTNLSVILLFCRFYLFQIAFPFHCIFQF